MRRSDLLAFVVALAAHAGVAYGLLRVPVRRAPASSTVEMEVVRKLPPPPPPVTKPTPVVEPERKVVPVKVKVAPPPTVAPPPNATPPKDPPKDPPKPVFGVTMDSTTDGDSSFAVPVGNTTMIDPSKSKKGGSAAPLPAAPPPAAKPDYKPISDLYVKQPPDIDSEACGRAITYPEEATELGIEGEVKLHIELDDKGKVHDIRVLSGLGHGLDQVAVAAMRHNPACKFSPAIATDGKAANYALTYSFRFELPR